MPPSSPHPKDTLQFIKDIWKPLHNNRATYLDKKELAARRISVSPLSFTTGRAEDGGDQFIQPLAIDKIQDILSQYKPWNRERVHSEISIESSLDNLWQARFLMYYFDNLLVGNEDEYKPGLLELTAWEMISPTILDRLSSSDYNTGIDWQGEVLFDMFDPAIPHKTCYLLDETPLQEHVLATSELTAILSITARRLMMPEWKHHRIIPVTVIASSGTRLRITQGIVEGKKRQVKVHMTRIIDFAAGHKERWTEVLTVLSWIIGKPVGKTD